jgi:heptosyltransferase-1
VVLVHGTSRTDKEWPAAHWVALGQRLQLAGFALALPHGNDAELVHSQWLAQQLSGAQVWPRLSLDELTQRMSQCSGVVGVDSGLSHMAVALDLPHVQIYNFDTAWRTGPEGVAHQRSVVNTTVPSVDAVWQAWQSCWQAKPQEEKAKP